MARAVYFQPIVAFTSSRPSANDSTALQDKTNNKLKDGRQARANCHYRCCLPSAGPGFVIGQSVGHDQQCLDWPRQSSCGPLGWRHLAPPRPRQERRSECINKEPDDGLLFTVSRSQSSMDTSCSRTSATSMLPSSRRRPRRLRQWTP